MPLQFKVQFERPIGFFGHKPLPFIRKEIDIALFSPEKGYKLAVELKFPRNGQYPEQMFKACQDIAFLEQHVDGGFKYGALVIAVDDPLFFSGDGKTELYRFFRTGQPVHGVIQKPTGAKDQAVAISGTHTIRWLRCGAEMKFSSVCLGSNADI